MGSPRRLIYYRNCPFPEIMPDIVQSPFVVSKFPFTPTTNGINWLTKITGKTKSSLAIEGKLSETELWDDLRHDYDIESTDDDISRYRDRLRRAVNRNK